MQGGGNHNGHDVGVVLSFNGDRSSYVDRRSIISGEMRCNVIIEISGCFLVRRSFASKCISIHVKYRDLKKVLRTQLSFMTRYCT